MRPKIAHKLKIFNKVHGNSLFHYVTDPPIAKFQRLNSKRNQYEETEYVPMKAKWRNQVSRSHSAKKDKCKHEQTKKKLNLSRWGSKITN